MVQLKITSADGTHEATCSFGTTSAGSPLDSMDAFLKELKSGKTAQPVQKVSKSGAEPDRPPSWTPMDCGELGVGWLGDDFRPFVGKKLTKVNRTTFIAA
jgi:hypothetical protein